MFKVRAGLHLLAYIFESGIFKDSFGIVNISGPPKTQEWDNKIIEYDLSNVFATRNREEPIIVDYTTV